ncbi:UbiA prenyltransferase family protein [Candidatus Gottesmanbacteria bacterium]|nr:UbiA prenyltransferase family protein [Candidatus Gottesmanbacteria bacterium]
MMVKTIPAVFRVLRPNQWVKNFIVFAAIIFNGKLFDPQYFLLSLTGFIIFCALSSASYIFNDVIDVKNDQVHPDKKNRPIAAGILSINTAIELAFLLVFFGLIGSIFVSTVFFTVSTLFTLLHVLYSTILKKYAVFDILGIAFSFILRAFAGEVITGYHLPFWLFLTILFVALFVASTKRHAELLREGAGTKTRPSLFQYREHLLDFYTSMFGSAAILAYSLFAFLEEPHTFNAPIRSFLTTVLPQALDRKWLVVTIPFIIYGLMRYTQLAYEGTQGERPEKIITTDIPLIASILIWGLGVILILYVL